MQGKSIFERLLLALALAASMSALTGCATGNDFVRFKPGAFTLGTTTRAEVYARVGPHPDAFGTMQAHGTTVRTMSYSYSSDFKKAVLPEISPAKVETFYFVNEVLVGIDYTDSFLGEGTDFDSRKIARIKKGITTRSEVIKLLGPAGGMYMPPLIAGTGYRALVYYSHQVSGYKLLSDKKLVVSYDRDGVVTDVKYTAKGVYERPPKITGTSSGS